MGHPGQGKCSSVLFSPDSQALFSLVSRSWGSGSPILGHFHAQRKAFSCTYYQGFPYSLTGKESTCNAGDLGSVPGSGISVGEGIGYSLQLEKEMATHSSILTWRTP